LYNLSSVAGVSPQAKSRARPMDLLLLAVIADIS
jgi:hypothetical protein